MIQMFHRKENTVRILIKEKAIGRLTCGFFLYCESFSL